MWISELIIDPLQCLIRISVTFNPDLPTMPIAWRFVFKEVGNLSIERYHDADHSCLGDFSSIRKRKLDSKRSAYKMDTGDAGITFEASSEYQEEYLANGFPES